MAAWPPHVAPFLSQPPFAAAEGNVSRAKAEGPPAGTQSEKPNTQPVEQGALTCCASHISVFGSFAPPSPAAFAISASGGGRAAFPSAADMPLVSEVVHPRGLSFVAQRKIVLLRDIHKKSWAEIAKAVRNIRNQKPCQKTVERYYRAFSARAGRVRTKYGNCGQKPHKVTQEVERFLVKKLRQLRTKTVCTSRTLQHAVAREKGRKVCASWVRKVLAKKGYRWLSKRQKRKYSAAAKKARLAFAKKALALGVAGLKRRLALAMDGVVLSLPPADTIDRFNFCRQGSDKMWRKPAEGLSPALSGDDPYGKQVPLARSVPFWGGCSAGGFAAVLFHKTKKVSVGEWCRAVVSGKMKKALAKAKGKKVNGQWHVLCDNESFLRSKVVAKAHQKIGVKLWKIPAKSPDLNPVERFWSWLRKKLRAMDLADAVKKKRALTKSQYVARVKRVLASKKAQGVAAACARGFRKVCKEVVSKKGAATHG